MIVNTHPALIVPKRREVYRQPLDLSKTMKPMEII
jgi:hypothetical protein